MKFHAFVACTHVRQAFLCTLATMGLVACGADQGTRGAATGSATGGITGTVPGRGPVPVSSAPGAALTISGHPVTAMNALSAYSFTPTASGTTGARLTFGVQNKPVWAIFDAASGALKGTPVAADVGTYENIVISVSNGASSASLAAFTVTINQISNGTATLDWMPPTENTDNSILANLAGYRVHYGTSAGNLTNLVQLANPGLGTYTVDNLSPGTWFFGVTAYATDGSESGLSGVVSTKLL